MAMFIELNKQSKHNITDDVVIRPVDGKLDQWMMEKSAKITLNLLSKTTKNHAGYHWGTKNAQFELHSTHQRFRHVHSKEHSL